MRRILSMILVILIAVFSVTPVYAVDRTSSVNTQEIITPMFTHIWILTPGLAINSSGKATSLGDVTIYNDSYSTVLTVQLQKSSGSYWSTIKTWTGSGTGITGVLIEEDYYVVRGTYRVCATAKVYDTSGKLLETQSVYSATVTY